MMKVLLQCPTYSSNFPGDDMGGDRASDAWFCFFLVSLFTEIEERCRSFSAHNHTHTHTHTHTLNEVQQRDTSDPGELSNAIECKLGLN